MFYLEHMPNCWFHHDAVQLSLLMRKLVFGVSDQVQHKPGCAITEDDKRLEILDLASREIVLSV